MRTFSEQEYDKLLGELFVRFPSVQNTGFSDVSYKPGLEGMKRFDDALGKPWKQYKCIHVAGTNGKGSVSSMIAAAISAQGYRVGLYTSPHITDFRERMKVVENGGFSLISKTEVWEFIQNQKETLDNLSFFEITTGMALRWFADRKVDYAVIETGLGGRLDSTNVIRPEISIITSIGLDHCALLGDSRQEIAAEKAGIFKKGVKALVGFKDNQTSGVFEKMAEEIEADLHFVDEEIELEGLDLSGPYQKMNVSTAYAALRLLGIDVSLEAIKNTAKITGFGGRWERLKDIPETIADIGHNPAALKINFAELEASSRPLFVVYGIMRDKDLDSIVPLFPRNAEFFLCAPGSSRALPVSNLEKKCKTLRPDLNFNAADSVAAAVDCAMSKARRFKNSLVYIGGSTFVVSEAISHLKK